MNDWQPEIRFAASWWKQRIIEAARKAFPENSLFGVLANPLIADSNLEVFTTNLESFIAKDFEKKKVPWNRQVSIEGSTVRKIGVEGAFISEPIRLACESTGLTEILPFIPTGCITIINPGKVFTALDRRSAEKTYIVEPGAEPEYLKGLHGHGI